ncbi:MAG: chemotaxis protein CheW, partial [Deltaproteobacteria bacterium]|nr:chemotaxis protein CheW [Deltaproteobacteria bacterium]
APVVAPIAVIAPAPAPAPIAAAPAAPAAPAPAAAAPAGDAPHRTDSTVRVDVALLDGLVNLAGELILARNRLHQFANTWSDTAHVATWQRLQLITSQLQEQVMKTRMQPIGAGWTKLTRTVRDLAAQLGKKARIEMEGEDTELDRTLIEAIRDPLTHVLRNAVDHGLEAPDERVRRGKPAEGVIRLRAYHDSGHVNIDISDDGGGIRTDRVRAKAVERGLITADQAAQMSDADAARLVFAPGFSTAEVVTNVSGRGVGMDVVRSNIEKIGGQVDLSSEVGVGTTLRITIPLTLAILPALIVECRGQRYAIPQAALRELVRIDAAHPIELVHSAPVFRLRGRLLPLVDLAAAVGDAPLEAPRLLLVVESEGTTLGLIVDRYHDSEEIVVKPLGRQLRECTQYGGATILGDGGVALILDIRQLARRAGLHAERRATSSAAALAPVAARDDRTTMVMLQQGVNGRFAVPLSSIDRIDEVDASRIERTGPDEVVQLQGDLLPVMRLGTALGVDTADSPILQLIVCHAANRKVGVAVDQILDIVEVLPELRWSNRRTGVTGTVLFEGRVVELLDLPQLIEATAPHLLWSAS